jgi:hypothetical protein
VAGFAVAGFAVAVFAVAVFAMAVFAMAVAVFAVIVRAPRDTTTNSINKLIPDCGSTKYKTQNTTDHSAAFSPPFL